MKEMKTALTKLQSPQFDLSESQIEELAEKLNINCSHLDTVLHQSDQLLHTALLKDKAKLPQLITKTKKVKVYDEASEKQTEEIKEITDFDIVKKWFQSLEHLVLIIGMLRDFITEKDMYKVMGQKTDYYYFLPKDTGGFTTITKSENAVIEDFQLYCEQSKLYKDMKSIIAFELDDQNRRKDEICYSLEAKHNQLSMFKPDPVEAVATNTEPKILSWVIGCLAQQDGTEGETWLREAMAYRIENPSVALPAVVLQGVGGTGKGILSGIADAVVLGYYAPDTGFTADILGDTNEVSLAKRPTPNINEVNKQKSCMNTLKRIVDKDAETVTLRETGGKYHEVDNGFWFWLSGNPRIAGDAIIHFDNDPNSNVNRRFSVFNQTKDLNSYVSFVESVSYDDAEDMIGDYVEGILKDPIKGRIELGKIKYWLTNNHMPKRKPKAFHGVSFNTVMGTSGYDQADELFEHLFSTHGYKTIEKSVAHKVYKSLEKQANPNSNVMGIRDFIEQMKRWAKNNLNATLQVKKTTYLKRKELGGNSQKKGYDVCFFGWKPDVVPFDGDWFEVCNLTNETTLKI